MDFFFCLISFFKVSKNRNLENKYSEIRVPVVECVQWHLSMDLFAHSYFPIRQLSFWCLEMQACFSSLFLKTKFFIFTLTYNIGFTIHS